MLFSLVSLTLALCLVPTLSQTPSKVMVGFYTEALCPGCLALSNGELTKAFEQIPDLFTLNYVPWGNAKIKWDRKFECQHGEMECVMNTVMACVLNYYPDQKDFWPFLHCIDKYGDLQNLKKAEKCASKTNINWDEINSCQSGKLGHELELKYANVTAQLNPPHKYTPWLTINGKHSTQAEDGELIKVVCSAYTGSNTPAACNNTLSL